MIFHRDWKQIAVTRGGRKGNGEGRLKGCGVSFSGDKSDLELDSDASCVTLNLLNTTEFYTEMVNSFMCTLNILPTLVILYTLLGGFYVDHLFNPNNKINSTLGNFLVVGGWNSAFTAKGASSVGGLRSCKPCGTATKKSK